MRARIYKGLVIFFAFLVFLFLLIFSFFGELRAFMPYFYKFGMIEEKNYLIIFQNNAELRPTGGFISSYAVLKIRYGIPSLKIENPYGEIDKYTEAPPYPYGDLLSSRFYNGFGFKDANFDPDFRLSAEKLIYFYNKYRPEEKVSGVIAVNYNFLEDLFNNFGEISLGGEKIEKERLFELLEHSVSNIDKHNMKEIDGRKQILLNLAANFKKQLWNPFKVKVFLQTFTNSLNKKDILLYFIDADLQKMAEEKDWAGILPQNIDGDFLYVNEANLGGAKSSRYLMKLIDYAVTKDLKNNWTSRLTINYDHLGSLNVPLNMDYSGYSRIYLPADISLKKTNLADYKITKLNTDNFSFTVVDFILKLKIGEEKTISLEYDLPKSIVKSDGYSLLIKKQPGDNNTRINFLFNLPLGETVKSDDLNLKEELGLYFGALSDDLKIKTEILPDNLSPRVVYQKIKDLKTIEIHFNEEVSPSAEDGFNYEFFDSNMKNPKNDELKIIKIDHIGRFITLHIAGMSEQKEEQYKLRLKNIYDLKGNMINPSPKEITLVQRLGEKD